MPRFRWDPDTLQYQRVERGWKGFLHQALLYVALVGLGAAGLYAVMSYTNWFASPRERQLARDLQRLQRRYEVLLRQMEEVERQLAQLHYKDDSIYRVIFGVPSLETDSMQIGYGGAAFAEDLSQNTHPFRLLIAAEEKLRTIQSQLHHQDRSFQQLLALAERREAFLRHVPSIQPIDNRYLKRIASGFGYRIDPIYKVRKFHEGVDFTAPRGTPIYATGDGVVQMVKYSRRGYGNHVIINHGFGYQTLYAHMSKIVVKPGQKVKRGQVIGYVGNTGKSTAPHLHYEVWKNGRKVDPINYFFNDLTIEEYEELVRLANHNQQSLD